MTLVIGTALRPQGIGGEIKVMPYTDNAEDAYARLKSVWIDGVERRVEAVSVREGYAYVKLEGVRDRNAAEALRGKQLRVRRQDAPPPPEGRYFIVDLIGCEVYAGERHLGVLKEIYQNGAADVYEVEGERRLLFPALKTVLKSVDVAARRIELHPQRLSEVAVYED